MSKRKLLSAAKPWWVYADLNTASWKKTIAAFFVFIFIGTPAVAFAYALRFGLIGEVFGPTGY